MTAVPTVLDQRFRAAAAASGELDVAYDVLDDTPVGRLLVGVSERGLCRVGFDPEPEAELERLARHFGPRVLRSPKALDRVRGELDEYLDGQRRELLEGRALVLAGRLDRQFGRGSLPPRRVDNGVRGDREHPRA